MKSRALLYFLLVLSLIALGGLWFFVGRNPQSRLAVFPAVVNRDCAPWDGGAFTVSIPVAERTRIAISIYRSPEIQFPTSYSFPDKSGQEGHALLLLPTGKPQPLTGKAWFQRVDQGSPVEGRFRFHSESGVQFEGKFVAGWGTEIVYCG